MAWLNVALLDVVLSIVYVMVFLIGDCMFLLPLVPGLPVYILSFLRGYGLPNLPRGDALGSRSINPQRKEEVLEL